VHCGDGHEERAHDLRRHRGTIAAARTPRRLCRARGAVVETSVMTPPRPMAIDCWLNPAFRATDYKPDFLVRVAREYFHREKEMFEVTPLEELLRQMDEAGVERAILTIDPHDPEPYAEVRSAF